MAAPVGPKKVKRYSDEFKVQAVRLANHPDIQTQDVAHAHAARQTADVRRHMLSLVLATALVAVAGPSQAQKPLPADHPLLGTWRFTVPGGLCSEIYTFRPDGTRQFSSAEEMGESAFELADAPSSRGFYAFTDTVTKTNGKSDCSGGTTPVGHKAQFFILFNPRNRGEFIMCQDESLAQCFGPIRKANPNAS